MRFDLLAVVWLKKFYIYIYTCVHIYIYIHICVIYIYIYVRIVPIDEGNQPCRHLPGFFFRTCPQSRHNLDGWYRCHGWRGVVGWPEAKMDGTWWRLTVGMSQKVAIERVLFSESIWFEILIWKILKITKKCQEWSSYYDSMMIWYRFKRVSGLVPSFFP